jgi:hypothetical protein
MNKTKIFVNTFINFESLNGCGTKRLQFFNFEEIYTEYGTI